MEKHTEIASMFGIMSIPTIILFKNGEEIGYVTSGTMSPTLKKALGLSYIKSEHASVGEEIEIQIRDKLCMAKIVKLPFYKKTDGV